MADKNTPCKQTVGRERYPLPFESCFYHVQKKKSSFFVVAKNIRRFFPLARLNLSSRKEGRFASGQGGQGPRAQLNTKTVDFSLTSRPTQTARSPANPIP